MSDRPNVVWVTIDSVRADRTTMGGHHRDTTPNLARIARDPGGEWFDTCVAQTRWTPASTASILTGTYLSTHTVGIESPEVRPLPGSLRTMAELLGERGYRSLGIGTNQYVSRATELSRGFDDFRFPTARNLHRTVGLRAIADYVWNVRRYGPGLTTDRRRHNVSSMVTRAAERWLSETGSPAFCYLHYNGTHYPYTPPASFLEPYAAEIGQSVESVLETCERVFEDVFREVANGLALTDAEFDAIRAAYDAELRYVDALVGQLYDHVQRLAGETILVVTGDHGETLGEHGWLGHHVLVSEELLRVPAVTSGLRVAPGAADGPVQHVDLTRTVLAACGVTSDQLEGVNLTEDRRRYAIAQRAPREHDRETLADHDPTIDLDRYRWDAVNVVHDGRFKLVTGETGTELFRLPDERTDQSDAFPRVREAMLAELDRRDQTFATSDATPPRAEFDEAARDRLERMGYL